MALSDLDALAKAIRDRNEEKRKGPVTKASGEVCPGCRRPMPKAKPDNKKSRKKPR